MTICAGPAESCALRILVVVQRVVVGRVGGVVFLRGRGVACHAGVGGRVGGVVLVFRVLERIRLVSLVCDCFHIGVRIDLRGVGVGIQISVFVVVEVVGR